MKEWILVASRAEAKVFKRSDENKNLQWVKTLTNKKGRWRERDFEHDKPGLSHAKFSGVNMPHALETQDTHAEVVAHHFAHTIGKVLAKGYREKQFENAVIFAEPKFLGRIKKVLPNHLKNTVLTFVNKDIEKARTEEIEKQISLQEAL